MTTNGGSSVPREAASDAPALADRFGEPQGPVKRPRSTSRAEPDFRTLFESAPGLYLVVEPDVPRYTIVAASDAYLRATRNKRDEILGRGFFEVFPDDAHGPEAPRMRERVASLECVVRNRIAHALPVHRHDVRRPEEEGGAFEERLWSTVNSPVFGSDGDLVYILHRVDDVTEFARLEQAGIEAQRVTAARQARQDKILSERMRMEEARRRDEETLRLSEAMFSGIISISADAIISVDEAQRITMFNEGAESIFGYSKAEILGLPLETLIPERFRQNHRQHVQKFAEGQAPARRVGTRSTEIYGLRKNGEEFPADAAISRLEIGGKTLLSVALRDVSEQKLVEKEQRLLADLGKILVSAGTDYQRLLTDVASMVVQNIADWCSIDIVQGEHVRRVKIVHADPGKAAICDALERYPVRRKAPSPVPEVLDTQGSLLMDDVTPEYVESLAQSAEHLRLMRALDTGSFIVVPLVARGQSLGTLGLGASRASRRYGPQDMRLVELLASRIAMAVDNARLHEALEQAIRARDEVLAIVAHDLRNPLNSILLQEQTLLRRGNEPERRDQKARESIRRAVLRMNGLIQDLLDVKRLEAGQRLSIRQDAVSTASVLAEAVEHQQAAISASNRKIEVVAEGMPPSVWADRGRLLQVFDNLLGNAIKFSRQRITVGARFDEDEVLFWVADDGTGVSAQDLPRLFDPYWQAKRMDRRGAGLGLSIVKAIVDAHGGRLWVESEVGVGTTFYFTLPTAHRAASRSSALLGSGEEIRSIAAPRR